MDYRRYIASSNVEFKVNDHLIECGSTTWQIRNIAATSIGRKTIPLKEPEPRFETAEPRLELKLFAMAMAVAVAWMVVRFLFGSPGFAVAAALGAAGVMIYFAVNRLNTKKSEWLAAKNKVEGHWKVWDEMHRNPPVLFSLMLETNAGSKPLFYSFDESQIARVNGMIKLSMEKKEMGDIRFEIETVNIGGEESINNFGSSIYNQSIQGV